MAYLSRRAGRPLRALSLAAALAAMVALAACGSSGSDGTVETQPTTAGAPSGEAVTVKIAVVPAATYAPILLGVDQGIFARHGIELDIDMGGLSPTVFPGLLKKQLDIAANTWGTLVIARHQGMPLTGIAPVDRGGATPEDDYQGIIARAGGARTLQELAGKTIAVPQLRGFTDAQLRSILKEAGVDLATVRFISLPFPEMAAALKAGHVDAVGVVEPFFSAIEADGGTPLSSLSREQLMGAVVASEAWVEENPETVRRFGEALREALQFSIDNPPLVRRALTDWLRIPEPVANTMTLPVWQLEIEEAKVQEIADMMLDAGAIDRPVDAGSIITPFPLPAQE